jgi:hypothetical protein
MHKAKGWDGVGYHFVIGNGTNSGDGQIEVGAALAEAEVGRARQDASTTASTSAASASAWSATSTPSARRPRSCESLTKLVTYLMQTYHIPASRHRPRDTKPTDCPGRYMNVAAVRRAVAQGPWPTPAAEADRNPDRWLGRT